MASTQEVKNTAGKVVGYSAHWRDVDGRSREKARDPNTGRPFRSKLAARKYGENEEATIRRGEGIRGSKITVGEFMREMLDDMRAAGMKPATIVAYDTHVKRLEAHPTFTTRRLKIGLNETAVQNVVNWLSAPQPEGRELSPSCVSSVITWLRRTARAAARAKLITYATMLAICDVERPKVKRPRKVPLTYPQVCAIADAMPPQFRALVLVQAGTGLRIGELRGLRMQDITWPLQVVGGRARKGWLHVDSQVYRDSGDRGSVKSEARDVPLPATVAAVLAKHIHDYPPLRLDDGDRIFYRPDRPDLRNPLTGYQTLMADVAERVGESDPNWPSKRVPGSKRLATHALRHHWVSALANRGVPLARIAKWAGNTEREILRTYLHDMPDVDERSADAIDEMWAEEEAPATNVGNLWGTDRPQGL